MYNFFFFHSLQCYSRSRVLYSGKIKLTNVFFYGLGFWFYSRNSTELKKTFSFIFLKKICCLIFLFFRFMVYLKLILVHVIRAEFIFPHSWIASCVQSFDDKTHFSMNFLVTHDSRIQEKMDVSLWRGRTN